MKVHNMLRMPISVSIHIDGKLDSVFIQGNSIVDLPEGAYVDSDWLYDNRDAVSVTNDPN